MKFNPDAQLNIHELAIEEPEKESELPFDPERDITEEEWEKIKQGLDNVTGLTRALYGSSAKIIEPKRFKDFFLDLDDNAAAKMETAEAEQKNRWAEMSDATIEYKLLFFPESFKDFIITNRDLEINSMTTERLKKEGEWGKILHRAGLVKIVRPDRIKDLKLDAVAWDGIREYLQGKMQAFGTADATKLRCVMDLLFAKILAADKVKITQNGLEIIVPKKKENLEQEAPQVPEVKQF